MMNAQLLYQDKNMTGEGIIWLSHLSLLLWVDIEGQTLNWFNPKTQFVNRHSFDAMLSSIVPYEKNKIMLFLQNRIVIFNLFTREEEVLRSLPFTSSQQRPNDVKASPDGRLFMGVMHLSDYPNNGALYRIDPDLSLHCLLHHQSIPNGIVWNTTLNLMYYIDSMKRCVERYTYHPENGDIDYRGIAVQVPEELGMPDGMTIDRDGNLWVAHWGGFGVYVWNPQTGKLIDKIALPVPNVASCTFGDNGLIYITTARAGLSQAELNQYPLSGSLFCCPTSAESGQNHYSFIKKEKHL